MPGEVRRQIRSSRAGPCSGTAPGSGPANRLLLGLAHPLAFDQRDGLGGLVVELLALAGLGAIAAAGDDQRQRAVGIGKAEMQGRKPAHRDADDMRLVDLERVEHGADVVPGAVLRIARRVLRHVRGRIAARVVGDAAIAPPEIAHLAFVAAIVVGEFVDEDDRRPRPGLLVIEAHAVIGRQVWHRFPLCCDSEPLILRARRAGGKRAPSTARLARIFEVVAVRSGPLRRYVRGRSGPGSPDRIRTSFPDQLPAMPRRQCQSAQRRPRSRRDLHWRGAAARQRAAHYSARIVAASGALTRPEKLSPNSDTTAETSAQSASA